MTEYIIEVDMSKADIEGNVPAITKQEVVRCRDCKFYDKEWTSEAYRNRSWCGKMGHYMQPYGFCAWAVRRDT